MSTLDIALWAIGGYAAILTAAMGWLFKMIAEERKARHAGHRDIDDRLREGVSYTEAERMVDLKIKPLKESLDRNTQAVVHLTNVLLERGLKVAD